ncbi:hypothetical protein Ciccas_012159 [Cichlidogyrus casuarinus]|uniref:Uncharacterized protein n=1 Tax=Cichlidogyrus casuarinus TaxID=1844966 RepID=A0ABD2PPY1_9PLAT
MASGANKMPGLLKGYYYFWRRLDKKPHECPAAGDWQGVIESPYDTDNGSLKTKVPACLPLFYDILRGSSSSSIRTVNHIQNQTGTYSGREKKARSRETGKY